MALQYVKDQTTELCLEAIRQNSSYLRHVRKQAPEICLAAVRQNGHALEYVKNQTPDVCLAAVRQNSSALKYVDDDERRYIASRRENYEERPTLKQSLANAAKRFFSGGSKKRSKSISQVQVDCSYIL